MGIVILLQEIKGGLVVASVVLLAWPRVPASSSAGWLIIDRSA